MQDARYIMMVMYHYVRRIAGSRFPGIKGRETAEFVEQIAYLQKHHRIIGLDEVIGGVADRAASWPKNAVVLTFDDGYKDHFDQVFPILRRLKISGTFFVPECAVRRCGILDVNKVHFLLAAPNCDVEAIVGEIDHRVEEAYSSALPEVQSVEAYRRQYWVPNRFDSAEVLYVKRMLQHALPEGLRLPLLNDLFHRRVTADEAGFADELYVSESDLREMLDHGMLVGAHGAQHLWLNRCDIATQAMEIERSAEFLAALGVEKKRWTFCYPYGAYNADTLKLVGEHGFGAGVTTAVELVNEKGFNPLLMPRLDTNDLPVSSAAAPNSWSRKLAGMAA